MLLTLKALFLSGSLFVGNASLFMPINMTQQTPQEGQYHRAAKLVSQSSYAALIEGDDEKAAKLLQEACDMGYGRACWYYAFETREQEDFERAKEELMRSCYQASPNVYSGESCTFLGIMASQGKADVPQSERELYERACSLNDGWGCKRLAYDFIQDEDSKQAEVVATKALKLLAQSCQDGNASNCYFAGSIYDGPISEEWLHKQDGDQSNYYYRLGCDLGNGDSCAHMRTPVE